MAKQKLDLKVVSYGPGVPGWQGYVSPKDGRWTLFVSKDGKAVLHSKRAKDASLLRPPPKSAAPSRRSRAQAEI